MMSSVLDAIGVAFSAVAVAEWPMLLFKLTLWLALAWTAHGLLAHACPTWRVRLWRAAAVGITLVPALALWGPRVGVAFETSKAATAEVNEAAPADRASATPPAKTPTPGQSAARLPSPFRHETWMAVEAEAREGFRMATGRSSRDAKPAFAALWLAGIAWALLRMAGGLIRAGRAARATSPAPEWLVLQCREVCAALGVKRQPGLRVSKALPGPVLVGLFKPVLLLPAGLMGPGRADDLPGLLAHEAAHLRWHDLWWNAFVRLATVVVWFHPLAWRIASAHSAACEEVCDAEAARHTGDTLAYRRTLARMALALHARKPLAVGIPMARTSEITRRVNALERLWRSRATGRAASIPVALAFVAVVVLLFVISGLSFWRRGPEGQYERARASRNLEMTLGANTYRVEAVTRWDRDGTAHIEDGRGRTLQNSTAPAPGYTTAARYMDIANVDFSVTPGDYEILLVRVFDPRDQEMLNWNETGSVGYSLDGTTVQLRSLGRLLPDTVDVWLRVVNLPKSDPVWTLPFKEGASVTMDHGGLLLREIRKGNWGSRLTMNPGQPGVIEWMPSEDSGDPNTTMVVLDWQFDGTKNLPRDTYVFYVVRRNGSRFVSDHPPHYLSPRTQTSYVIRLEVPLEEIDHFKLRPYREWETRTTFYFEGVKLPHVSDAPFQPPPEIVVDVDGEEGTFTSEALAPCRIEFQVERGKTKKGMFSNENRYWYTPASDPVQKRDTATTVLYDSKDIYLNDYALTLFDRDGAPIGGGGSSDACAISLPSQFVAGYRTFDVPVEQIGKIRLELNPAGDKEPESARKKRRSW